MFSSVATDFGSWTIPYLLDVSLSITVNPLYNDIRYNSKICYNVNPICTNISGSCIFFIDTPMLFFGKTYVLDIY